MSTHKKPEATFSITSSILHKQDVFWETILVAYERTIKELKVEENEMQNYVFELKILIQAIGIFNLMKLLNESSDANLISQLLQLKCICPKDVDKEEPIKVETLSFTLNHNDLKQMTKIKELVSRERELIDEVNVLRIKDMTLTQMKLNMDNLMRSHFPNMVFSTGTKISDIPRQIQKLVKEVRELNEELKDLQNDNKILKDNAYVTLPNELFKLKKKNNAIEDQIAEMKRQLEDLLNKDHMKVMRDILAKHLCTIDELCCMVKSMQEEAEVLKESIELIKKLE